MEGEREINRVSFLEKEVKKSEQENNSEGKKKEHNRSNEKKFNSFLSKPRGERKDFEKRQLRPRLQTEKLGT